jgi:Transposase IS4
VEPLPEIFKPVLEQPIPHFEPEQRVPFDSMRPNISCNDPLQLFLHLFGEQSLEQIVTSTNTNASFYTQKPRTYNPRPWIPLTRNELIVFIGTLFAMGRHPEHNREYYWRENGRHFGQYISKTRWEQIHRFLAVSTEERQQEQPWWWKLEHLVSVIRPNLEQATSPASWLAVDEIMIPFKGRSAHTVKMKNKPIKEAVIGMVWSDLVLVWSDLVLVWSDLVLVWSDLVLVWSDLVLVWSRPPRVGLV